MSTIHYNIYISRIARYAKAPFRGLGVVSCLLAVAPFRGLWGVRGVGVMLCLLAVAPFRGLGVVRGMGVPPKVLGGETVVIGRVTDEADGTPIPSANVYFKGTDDGTATDDAGYFLLRTGDEGGRLVISAVGYRTEQVRIKGGGTAYVDMPLHEQFTALDEVLVLPGSNPALPLMKRARLMRKANDLTTRPGYRATATAQSVVMLSHEGDARLGRRLVQQLRAGSLTESDSALLVPLYVAESDYAVTDRGWQETDRRLHATSQETDHAVMQLTQGLSPRMNFYRNAVTLFGKDLVSPMANIGNTYYDYWLADSLTGPLGKQYEVHFRPKNPKDPAFGGRLRLDSATLALTYLEADLSPHANVNYVHALGVTQRFDTVAGGAWAPVNEQQAVALGYAARRDSLTLPAELLVRQRLEMSGTRVSPLPPDSFAGTPYTVEALEQKLQAADNTPLMRTARWIADAALTSYARAGWVDFGPLAQVMRLTDQEGFRLALPLRTNERLWRNISLGGYAGYGFRDHSLGWQAFGQVRLPGRQRQVIGLSYTDDNRRIDYDYNAFARREDVWDSGDEDIVSTILSFHSATRVSRRREWQLSYDRDLGSRVELTAHVRAHTLLPHSTLPMSLGGEGVSALHRQSLTVAARLSWDERKYADHLRRLHIGTFRPVTYLIAEGGRYDTGLSRGWYGRFTASVGQRMPTPVGTWRYFAEAGCLAGRVPYPLLAISPGNEPNGIAFYQFNRMRYLEFAHDRYVQVNTEFVFNGLLFNRIPLVKHLNLREMVALKAVWGGLSDRHRAALDFPALPDYLRPMRVPYVEGSIGVTNLLGIFSFQYNYRFTHHYEGVAAGRFCFGLRFGF